MVYYNRRQFLQRSTLGFAGATLGLSMLGHGGAQAANTGGYKALVGIMLKGGMDNNDTLLPKDAESYDALKALRPGIFEGHNSEDEQSSRSRENILELNLPSPSRFNGRRFGLPRELSDVQDMFNSGEAGIVANVGPLLESADRESVEAGRVLLPKRLFSHNDQQSSWMALDTEGARLGWGGQFADAVLTADPTTDPTYLAITSGFSDVFLSGNHARSFRIPNVGQNVGVDAVLDESYLGLGSDRDEARIKLNAFLRRQSFDHKNLFRKDAVSMAGRGIDSLISYSERAAVSVPLTTIFPDTNLGKQLGSIAQAISLRGVLNVSRQVYYSSQGDYDLHDNQAIKIPTLHEEFNDAVVAFRAAMIEMGVWEDVLVFTMSDFGRTMVGNGDGSDHGWGGHHFVFGGSIKGGEIYGNVPDIDLGHSQYTSRRGRLIPTTSVEQHAAALGGWFGLDSAELANIFPNLDRFDREALSFV